jgi:AcrR family transcriptional regulator
MANIKNNSASRDTQRRLLQAAGEVFAERGFQSATMKEITDRAGASLASINYHFSDKAALYAAVIRSVEAAVVRDLPPVDDSDGPPTLQLRRFVRTLVERLLRRDAPTWECILIGRELTRPTGALASFIEHVVRPMTDKLTAIVAAVTGRKPAEATVGLVVASIIAQCHYHMHQRLSMGELHPQLADRPDDSVIADHIATFSLAGVEAFGVKPGRSAGLGVARRVRRKPASTGAAAR